MRPEQGIFSNIYVYKNTYIFELATNKKEDMNLK